MKLARLGIWKRLRDGAATGGRERPEGEGKGGRRRALWLGLAVAVLAVANVVDIFFLSDQEAPPRKTAARTVAPRDAAPTAPRETAPAAPSEAVAVAPSGAVAAARAAPKSEQALEARLQRLREVSLSADKINAAYGKAAPAYAEVVAPLQTLIPNGADPRKALDGMLRESAKRWGTEVTSLVIGEASMRGPGISQVRATIGVRSADADGLMRFLWMVGDPAAGMVWQDLNLVADARARRLELTGEVLALFVVLAE